MIAKDALNDFNKKLTGAIAVLSEKNHAVVLPKNAIYAGADDKTPWVWDEILSGSQDEK